MLPLVSADQTPVAWSLHQAGRECEPREAAWKRAKTRSMTSGAASRSSSCTAPGRAGARSPWPGPVRRVAPTVSVAGPKPNRR